MSNNVWRRYRAAYADCRNLTGAALSKAEDAERDAIFDMVSTKADDLARVGHKLDVLIDVLELLGPGMVRPARPRICLTASGTMSRRWQRHERKSQ
jgi:hypothetical protein